MRDEGAQKTKSVYGKKGPNWSNVNKLVLDSTL